MSFKLQPELLSELLLSKLNQHHLTNQIKEFYSGITVGKFCNVCLYMNPQVMCVVLKRGNKHKNH